MLTQHEANVNSWEAQNGNSIFRLGHDLNENSIVFDIGGYKGLFTESVSNRFNCFIYVFEPIKEFYDVINEKFKNNNKIKVFNFGLSNKTSLDIMFKSNDASSIIPLKDSRNEKVQMMDIVDFLEKEDLKRIDLMEINIEGGEYELLYHMIEKDIVKDITNIQIQFHQNVEDYESKKAYIREHLENTHFSNYCFEHIWENWRLK